VARHLVDLIPGAKYAEFPGADFWCCIQNGDDILAAMEEFVTGAPRRINVDRVLATVLFTDIVGSTTRAADLGDRRWKELLDRHDEITRDCIERFGGRVVKTTGDGALATFDSPGRAIRCAVELNLLLRGVGINIRAGLHRPRWRREWFDRCRARRPGGSQPRRRLLPERRCRSRSERYAFAHPIRGQTPSGGLVVVRI
jgi:hypothetical protein